MANGTKSGGRNFKPGVSGNPRGRPKSAQHVVTLRAKCKEEVIEAIATCLLAKQAELRVIGQDPEASSAQALVAALLIRAISGGCHNRAQLLMNYILGKPKPFEDDDEELEDIKTPLQGVPTGVLMKLLREHGQSGE